MSAAPAIESVRCEVRKFPTPAPEADGTFEWDATTAVVVVLETAGCAGLGWTYSSPAAHSVVLHHLADVVRGRSAFDITSGWEAMHRAGRNIGTRGLWLQAMSAVDVAWWDLKARLLGASLIDLLGRCREAVPVYGSGGFTTMDDEQLAEQVADWRRLGCTAMKIKIGEHRGHCVERDLRRVRQLQEDAGAGVALMVDANGAYSVGQAGRVGAELDELGVVWFEEPVSSDDVSGLRRLRDDLRCDVAAGEYVAELDDLRALLPAVDCVQLDATRCGGYTGFLRGAAVAAAHHLEVSAHCAPALHRPVAAAVPNLRHVEYFADHARLEPELLDGVPPVRDGFLPADTEGTGHGLGLRGTGPAR
jgi:L-alanine-DL-glutamate epimerase-like enolase superfamily enzyme